MGSSSEASAARAVSITRACGELLRHPWQRLVLRWNGKAAVLSALFRGVIFLIASSRSHHAGRAGAVLSEALFGALCAGFFGTITEAIRFAEPEWQAELALAGIVPLCFQSGDVLFHLALGDAAFRSGMIASAIFTALSAAFNLYVMRRNTLVVGKGARPFHRDLAELPRLALFFVGAGALRVWRPLASALRGGARA